MERTRSSDLPPPPPVPLAPSLPTPPHTPPLPRPTASGVVERLVSLPEVKPDRREPGSGKYGATALYMASAAGDLECVRLLLKAGANKWERCCNNDVALNVAKRKGYTEICNCLMSPVIYGSKVSLFGMSRPECNGTEGVVKSYHPDGSGPLGGFVS